MLSTEILIASHYLIILLSLLVLFRRLLKDSASFFLNYITYLLSFGILYFSLPSIITLSSIESPVGALPKTINYTAFVGLYFNVVFFIGYLFTNGESSKVFFHQIKTNKFSNSIVLIAGFAIAIYVLVLILINFPYILSIYGNRRAQADFDQLLMGTYKIYFASSIQVIIIGYLFLVNNNKNYFLLFAPFVLQGVLLSDRDFILKGIILLILYLSLIGFRIKLKSIFLAIGILISIGVFRTLSYDNSRLLISLVQEFLLTWSTTHLIVEAPEQSDLVSSLVFSLSKASIPGTYELVFGDYNHYYEIITKYNPLIAGLAGSVIAETLSYKNDIVTFFMPIGIVIYAFVMNKIVRLRYLTAKLFFVLGVLFIHSIIRFTFLEYVFYPIFIMLFFGFWIIYIDVKYSKFWRIN